MEGQFGLDNHSVLKAFRATLRALTHTHFRNISDEAVELEESACEYVAETGFSLPEKCISGWMQKPLEEAARISAINIKTHYETNLLIYLKRIAIMKIDLVQELSSIKALPQKSFNAVLSAVMHCLETNMSFPQVYAQRLSMAKLDLPSSISEEASILVGSLHSLLPDKSAESHGRCFFSLLSSLEEYSNYRRELYERGKLSQFQKRSKVHEWRFNLVPRLSWRPKHIRLSSTGLKKLLEKVQRQNSRSEISARIERAFAEYDLHEDQHDKNLAFWKNFFDLSRVLKAKNLNGLGKKRFGNTILTDGVSVCAGIETTKSQRKNDDESLPSASASASSVEHFYEGVKKMKLKPLPLHQKVIGLDPGKTNIATWVEDTSSVEGSMEIRQKQYTKKMNRRVREFCPGVLDALSSKTTSFDLLADCYRQMRSVEDQVLAAFFTGTLWYQKQKMRRYLKEQKALEDVVANVLGTRIKKEQKKIVVAYGDADMSHNIGGVSPYLSTKFYRKMKASASVSLVLEFKTSKLCSSCFQPLKNPTKNQYKVLCCDNSRCTHNALIGEGISICLRGIYC